MIKNTPLGYAYELNLTFKSVSLDKVDLKSFKKLLFKNISEEEWIEIKQINLEAEMDYDMIYHYVNYISVFGTKK